jgi:hypothetical protein
VKSLGRAVEDQSALQHIKECVGGRGCVAATGEDAMDFDPHAMNENRLDSWKEIAAYLRREVRTVQRWEKNEGLPVRRHFHERIGTVYGFKDEMDRWMESRASLGARSRSVLGLRKPSSEGSISAPGASSAGIQPTRPARQANKLEPFPRTQLGYIPALIYIDPDSLPREVIAGRRKTRGLSAGKRNSRNFLMLQRRPHSNPLSRNPATWE